MKLYNTFTKKKEEFESLKKGEVGMYVCGPTAYDVGHIGHARSTVSFDMIRRYFIYKGYKVTFVSNITDVDDKIITRAAEEKITEKQLVERIIPEYAHDYGALSVIPPDHQPRATEYIGQMVELIEKLIEKGFAYVTEDGVYFEVRKFKEYGKLSGQKLSEIQSGARIAIDEKKKNPEDFALWKKTKPGEETALWLGPAGIKGRPGWHIECSAMSSALLGETIDVHGGGIDLQFPHHEDEIAQSEMASGKKFARYWLHNGHIQVNKEKMSKSLGNFLTIKEILAKHRAAVVRYFLISTHYRMPIDFTDSLLAQARESLKRLRDCFRAVSKIAAQPDDHDPNIFVEDIIYRAQKGFEESLDDDFEISRALSFIFDFVNEINKLIAEGDLSVREAKLVREFFVNIDTVLAVIQEEDPALSKEVEQLINERNEARARKDFKRSDEIREILKKRGIELEDSKDRTLWKKSL